MVVAHLHSPVLEQDTHCFHCCHAHRISMFLMPTFVVVVLLNQLDRHNISFAALTMNRCTALRCCHQLFQS